MINTRQIKFIVNYYLTRCIRQTTNTSTSQLNKLINKLLFSNKLYIIMIIQYNYTYTLTRRYR